MVLWFLVLIAALSTYLLANARSETAIARNIRGAAIAEALADAAIAQAVFNQTGRADRWRLDGEPHLISLPDGEATIRLYDENQKVNPNLASDALMASLFEAAGIGRALSMRLGASIADWVGSETEPRALGAKKQQYLDAGRSYGPPNAPIESIDELQLVLGMTPEILARVRPYLSIHTQSETPRATNASPIIRRALTLAAVAPAEVGPGDEESAPVVTPRGTLATPTPVPSDAGMSDEDLVRLVITARASTGGLFVRDAVLRLDLSSLKGYVVLDWRRGDLVE